MKVFSGMRLGQICFFHVPEVQVPYGKKTFGKYAHSVGVEFTGIDKDPEILGKPTGWYDYLKRKLQFPFRATCIAERAISPLRKSDEVEVIEMASEKECGHDMFVSVKGEKPERLELAVPLSQLEPISAGHEQTKRVAAEWHRWVRQGYQF